MTFKIEHIISQGRMVRLLAASLSDDKSFTLTENSFLGKFPLKQEIQVHFPRKNDNSDLIQPTLFSFILAIRSDMAFIKIGDILELSNDSKKL